LADLKSGRDLASILGGGRDHHGRGKGISETRIKVATLESFVEETLVRFALDSQKIRTHPLAGIRLNSKKTPVDRHSWKGEKRKINACDKPLYEGRIRSYFPLPPKILVLGGGGKSNSQERDREKGG